MGRRKIEIRAIKDDRNRSVTFLKRKGGLFKKAHELSVLCSVDVAVVIFGHNKKLYEFSSGDINETLRRYNYYGPPHEHKGPADFKNKGGDDDDEDEEEDDLPLHREDSLPPQHPMMGQHLQHHGSFQHIRAPGPSASPPMPQNGFMQRNGTPQPPMDSRPSSRNTIRRPSSNLVPMQHPHTTPTPPQNAFAYVPNPPLYQPSANVPPPQPSPQPSFQFQHQQHTPQPQHQQQQLSPPQPYIQEPQHQAPHPSPPRNGMLQPPPQPTQRTSPQPQQQEFRPNEHMTPPQIKHLSSKSRSIFTPIDEGGSVLAQHFFGAPDPPRREIKRESPPDLKRLPRQATHPPQSKPIPLPPRPQSSSSFRPPTRSDTGGSKSGARPKLNLQIPSEASDGEPTSVSPLAGTALNSANPTRDSGHHNLILPPPSPSASALLSAGASGPPNPFARPPPPTSNNNNNQNNNAYTENNRSNNLETPGSALPSRYMDRDLLASPGGIFGAWDNFVGASPNVATPAERTTIGHGWGKPEGVEEATGKRKGDELVGDVKKLKT